MNNTKQYVIPKNGFAGEPFYLYYATASFHPGPLKRIYENKQDISKHSLLNQFNNNQSLRYTSDTSKQPYFQYGDSLRQWSLGNDMTNPELCGCGDKPGVKKQ